MIGFQNNRFCREAWHIVQEKSNSANQRSIERSIILSFLYWISLFHSPSFHPLFLPFWLPSHSASFPTPSLPPAYHSFSLFLFHSPIFIEILSYTMFSARHWAYKHKRETIISSFMKRVRQIIGWSQHNAIILIKSLFGGAYYILAVPKYVFILFLWSRKKPYVLSMNIPRLQGKKPGEETIFPKLLLPLRGFRVKTGP